MFQSNKEYIDFLIHSGVHTFLNEKPNNLIKDKEIHEETDDTNDIKFVGLSSYKFPKTINFFKYN